MKYIVYKVDDNGKFHVIESMSLSSIKQLYKLEDKIYSFMINELKEYGRYWLKDDEMVRAVKEEKKCT